MTFLGRVHYYFKTFCTTWENESLSTMITMKANYNVLIENQKILNETYNKISFYKRKKGRYGCRIKRN